MSFRQDLRTSQSLRLDPRVLLSSQLLQLAQTELESAIETELMENPALERLEPTEPITDEVILSKIAPKELTPSSSDYEFQRSLPQGTQEITDWLDFAASSDSLQEHLKAQLFSSIPHDLLPVAYFVAESVDERGYLTTPVEEIALCCDCSLEEASLCVSALKKCEPSGVGAANLQECLFLQLQHETTHEGRLAKAIVKRDFEELIQRNTRSLMRRYRVLPEVVQKAFDLIGTLTPYPAEGFSVSRVSSLATLPPVVPDIVLNRTETGWTIEVKGSDSQDFIINRAYQERLDTLNNQRKAPKDEKRHLTEYIERAERFRECLDQRKKTLRRIGEYLIANQTGFVSTGEYRFLTELTRSKLAKDLGLHESTVSRATQGKFVQMANGEIVSFDVFFKPALRIQHMISEILRYENPSSPLSDEQIMQILSEKGVTVARRTVNKYRDRSKHLSSRKRRTA